jgi:hypothetical protein
MKWLQDLFLYWRQRCEEDGPRPLVTMIVETILALGAVGLLIGMATAYYLMRSDHHLSAEGWPQNVREFWMMTTVLGSSFIIFGAPFYFQARTMSITRRGS